MSLDVIDQLLPDLVERTKADAWFAGIQVLAEDKSDWATKIRQALGYLGGGEGKIGGCIIWQEPSLDDIYKNSPRGPMEIKLVALLLYDQLAAMQAGIGIGIKPLAICRRLRTLKFYMAPYLASPLELDSPFIRPTDFAFEGQKTPTLLAYEARFKCREADRDSTVWVGLPQFTFALGSFSLASATGGAALYYTLDGTYPRAGNSAAVLYTAPVAVAPGTEIRAAGYLAGAIPSNVAIETAP